MSAAVKVIVIEDDDGLRRALQRLLNAAGFECVTYASAEALLHETLDPRTCCLVCDQNLPAMSGLELLATLHQRKIRVPLVLMTAFDTPGLRARADRGGAAGYLVKPFSRSALVEAIGSAIALSGSPVRPSVQ
ncbi:FixJ family two-component response regulator [Angulomicrobium tetraedrale]|uniref:FixJ family two-component response regulator n=1 Tax=Ancylobacter tetraedralis TaxID=217068 RepID=A0A839ZDF4_9HYPH|nr:response regulator [Ancylobacter tetraedralis]MBB3772717.1 FixJ family two-component response regulator [Ancylobacter tetraedralis]